MPPISGVLKNAYLETFKKGIQNTATSDGPLKPGPGKGQGRGGGGDRDP